LFETDLIQYNYSVSNSVTADMDDFMSISVSPSVVSFGSIPRGIDIIKAGNNIVINATASETYDNSVYVYVDVVGTDADFYDALLELDDDAGFEDITGISPLTIGEDSIETYPTRLHGNTLNIPAGPKSATIVYTVYGELI